jgi:hypothetical protein
MRLRHRIAALVAGLGFASTGFAAPPKSEKNDPPVIKAPKVEKPQPKFEPKPLPAPKFEPKPLPLPKFEPKPLPKPLPPVVAKPEVKLPPVVLPKPDPKPVVKQPAPVAKPAVGIKLPAGKKFDQAELVKLKPPVDLTKTKPEVVLASKPPKDFKVKPIALDQIQVPQNAVKVAKLNVGVVNSKQAFVLNQNAYVGNGYHTKYGVKTAFGFAYPGQFHSHWHHCVWDPCFKCHYYYCPSVACYYYWNPVDVCYYPCHWFVDYGTCYYPWWINGGFGGYGYFVVACLSIFVKW